MARIPVLGRQGLPGGRVTAPAAGNSAVTSDVRGAPAGRPRNTDGINASPVGGQQPITPPSQVGRSTYARPFQNGRLIARDRHIISRRGRSTAGTKASTNPGTPNPSHDGPPRPAYEMVNRTLSWQQGTDSTRNDDNNAFHASTFAGKRKFPLSNQGSAVYEPVYGGTPGLYRPYGARGWVLGPEPTTYSLPGGPRRPGVLLEIGAAGDGPQRVYGGKPHGLHSPTVPPLKATLPRFGAVPQQVPGRAQRPANSKIAGQSYSQTVVPQDGRGGGPLPELAPQRVAGVISRFVRR